MNNKEKGSFYEQKTLEYITSIGMTLIEKNYSCKFGEVDIIARDHNSIVFIEVKYRSNQQYGHPSQSINYYKRRNIINVSKWYISNKRLYDVGIRYDVGIWVDGKIEYYKGAFDYDS